MNYLRCGVFISLMLASLDARIGAVKTQHAELNKKILFHEFCYEEKILKENGFRICL